MYICCECGHVFEEPIHWEETHGLDYGPFEKWSGCPYCKGDYTEAEYCSICGEAVTGDYIVIDDIGQIVCDNCYTNHNICE